MVETTVSRSSTRTVTSRLSPTRRIARRAFFRRIIAASSSSSYAPTWSNPPGSAMDAIDAEGRAFACARPFVWNNIDVGGRMGIVRMGDGESLWVHSPTALDDATRLAVTSLGRVAHVVSPNYEHVKYAAQWKEAFPDAVLYGCPGLKDRMPNVYDVDLRDGVPESWRRFELAWFDARRRPSWVERFQRSRFPPRPIRNALRHGCVLELSERRRRRRASASRHGGVEISDGSTLFTNISQRHGHRQGAFSADFEARVRRVGLVHARPVSRHRGARGKSQTDASTTLEPSSVRR